MEKRNQGKFQRAALPCATMAKENFDKRYENAAEVRGAIYRHRFVQRGSFKNQR